MNTFTFIVGPVAAGKTIFMENKLYYTNKNECNFFDHDQKKLMIQLYGADKNKVNDLNLSIALNNAIDDSLNNYKDFMMQINFTNEQLDQINTYLEDYKHKFVFNAHFIAVCDTKILKQRANKRELLGGHSYEEKSIEKSFKQSFKNFTAYLPKFNSVSFWDNSKDFDFKNIEPQLVFENGNLTFQNLNITDYSKVLLREISD